MAIDELNMSIESAQMIRKLLFKKIAQYELVVKEMILSGSDSSTAFTKLKEFYTQFENIQKSITNFFITKNSEYVNKSISSQQNDYHPNGSINEYRLDNSFYSNNDSHFKPENFDTPYYPNSHLVTQMTQNTYYDNNNLNQINPWTSNEPPMNDYSLNSKELKDEFRLNAMSILLSNPRLTLSSFSIAFNNISNQKIDFNYMTEKELRTLFKELNGVILQKNGKRDSFNIINVKVVCYPYKKTAVCQCGLDCDGKKGELALGWRTMQCVAEIKTGCVLKASCNFLHTRTMYD